MPALSCRVVLLLSLACLLSLGPSYAAAATAGAGTGAAAASGGPNGPSREKVLPRSLRGQAAIDALGARLGEVAARNGMAAGRLERLLREDRTAWVAEEGRVYFAETTPEQTMTATSTGATYTPDWPTSQTFALHSRPTASRKIFLDFDGATVQDTAWNGTGSGDIANGTYIGFDTDGSPSTFSTSEHGFVQEVWRQVAETYSPFDVDVTTQDPGADGVRRSSTSDLTYGTQVLVTSASAPRTQVCGSCLGVAWMGTFDNVDTAGRYQPAWVFAYSKSFDPMIVAQAAAHETGHTLGLSHDGTSSSSYYAGTAGWGPVMGSASGRALTQFSKGEYSGASNTEDDLAVIQSTGLPLRADDHGNDVGTADPLGARSAYDARGVIGTRSDRDVFAVDRACAADLAVTASGIGAQTTLDLSLQVLDGAGRVLATSSPTSGRTGTSVPVSTGMDAAVTIPAAAAGRYYLRVDGVGNGSPASGGWSDYASLGQYHLTATGCPDGTAAPAPTTPTSTGTTSGTSTGTATPLATRPGAPAIGWSTSGAPGGSITATARWYAPRSNGGSAITRYRVAALKIGSSGRVVRSYLTGYLAPSARAVSLRLPRGRYVFKAMACNRVGASTWSRTSRLVVAR